MNVRVDLSTSENKIFPTVQIVGYTARTVVVSCFTKNPPHKSHPHSLMGRAGCMKGLSTMEVPQETMTAAFTNLGTQCVRRKDAETTLKVKEEIGFNNGNKLIDLNVLRLCFQPFTESVESKLTVFRL